jgi:hypothetical protein
MFMRRERHKWADGDGILLLLLRRGSEEEQLRT